VGRFPSVLPSGLRLRPLRQTGFHPTGQTCFPIKIRCLPPAFSPSHVKSRLCWPLLRQEAEEAAFLLVALALLLLIPRMVLGDGGPQDSSECFKLPTSRNFQSNPLANPSASHVFAAYWACSASLVSETLVYGLEHWLG
jgi:hypothetical protein